MNIYSINKVCNLILIEGRLAVRLHNQKNCITKLGGNLLDKSNQMMLKSCGKYLKNSKAHQLYSFLTFLSHTNNCV
jgi:hypothetical protein